MIALGQVSVITILREQRNAETEKSAVIKFLVPPYGIYIKMYLSV